MVYANCSEVVTFLDDIWHEFWKRGVSDELRVIEGLGLLLVGEKAGIWEEIPDGIRVPHIDWIDEMLYERMGQHGVPEFSDLSEYGLDSKDLFWPVLKILRQVRNIITPSELFDRCIIPRITSMTRGGRYPTPRHLTHWMVDLVKPKDGETLGDFACGSGGFLVASKNHLLKVTGVEISPNWARIAWVNTILHDLPNPEIQSTNAFIFFNTQSHRNEFDCISMNPPFGEIIDPILISKVFGERLSGRSETLFCWLAYETLKNNGRMVVMLPSSSLIANSSGEKILRDILLEDNSLKAVISLPKDAIQPYSTLPTYVLVIQRPSEEETIHYDDIWFFRAKSDGYTSGRNRQEDPEHNDLPLISAALSTQLISNNQQEVKATVDISILKSAEKVLGYRFTSISGTSFKLHNLRLNKENTSCIYLLETKTNKGEDLICVANETIYRGLPDEKPLSPKYKSIPSLIGEYTFVDEELEKYRVFLEKDLIEVRKGNIQIASSLSVTNSETTIAYCMVVSKGGVPQSPVFPIKADGWFKKHGFPNYLDLCDVNGIVSGSLVLFPPQGVIGCKLISENGNECFLFRNDKEKLAIIWLVLGKSLSFIYVTSLNEVFTSNPKQVGCVVDDQSSIIGIGVPAATILETEDRNLLPSTYFPTMVTEILVRSTAEILAEIKINQNRLVDRIDRLMGIAELRPIATATLPPKVIDIQTPPINLLGTQKLIWEAIEKMRETVAVQDYQTPMPFQADDIKVDVPTSDVQRALELFERLGILVKVSYADVPYFRLLTESDVIGRKI